MGNSSMPVADIQLYTGNIPNGVEESVQGLLGATLSELTAFSFTAGTNMCYGFTRVGLFELTGSVQVVVHIPEYERTYVGSLIRQKGQLEHGQII